MSGLLTMSGDTFEYDLNDRQNETQHLNNRRRPSAGSCQRQFRAGSESKSQYNDRSRVFIITRLGISNHKSRMERSFPNRKSCIGDAKNVEVRIPVESIKSTKGKLMDSKTYDAFNAEKYPFIVYNVTSVKVNQSAGVLDAKGTLTMAGVSRPVDLQAKYKVLPSGDLQITVSKSLKMTEFKMDPPTAMMGTIKVGDEVTVSFDVTINTKLIQ
jgi:polyisoprenoid-binding protein YceI